MIGIIRDGLYYYNSIKIIFKNLIAINGPTRDRTWEYSV